MTESLRYIDIKALNFSASQVRAVSDFMDAYVTLMLANAEKHHGPDAGIALMVTLADLFCGHIVQQNAVGVLRPEHVNACLHAIAQVIPEKLLQ
jgi:hypothetical protein